MNTAQNSKNSKDKEPLNVKICVNCKDIWIHRVGMNYCGSCGTGTFEQTHDSNFNKAENYPKINDVFESVRNPMFPIACNGWWLESYMIEAIEKHGERLGYGRLEQMASAMYEIKMRCGE